MILPSSLSTKVDTDKLAKDLETHFSKYGRCHVKIKQDKKKCLPGAFVQFEVFPLGPTLFYVVYSYEGTTR